MKDQGRLLRGLSCNGMPFAANQTPAYPRGKALYKQLHKSARFPLWREAGQPRSH